MSTEDDLLTPITILYTLKRAVSVQHLQEGGLDD
jgi:hypothetical protein